MSNSKVTPELFEKVDTFLKTHTLAEAQKRFGLSMGTLSRIKRHASFKEMKGNPWRRSGTKIPDRPVPDTPFDRSDEPRPIIPPSKGVTPEDNGPVKSRPALRSQCEPTKFNSRTAKEWYDAYDVQKKRADELEKLLNQAKESNGRLVKNLNSAVLAADTEHDKKDKRIIELEHQLVMKNKQIHELLVQQQMAQQTDDGRYISVTIGDTTVSITRHGNEVSTGTEKTTKE